MSKKYFNKKIKRRAKINLKRYGERKKRFSKRMGGVIGESVMIENRNTDADDLSLKKKEIS